MAKRMIGLAEVGVHLRMPYQDVHRALLMGKLKGEKRGGRWFITAESAEQFRKEREDEKAIACAQ